MTNHHGGKPKDQKRSYCRGHQYINPHVRRTSYDGILTIVGYELEYGRYRAGGLWSRFLRRY